MVEQIFYTQDFLEYIALTISSMPSTLSSGNIDGCTVTDNIVLGPSGQRSGKKNKVKNKIDGRIAEAKARRDKKDRLTNQFWHCGTDTSMTTTTDFFYGTAPSIGVLQRLFEIGFNSLNDYWAIPFNTASELCPSTISADWGGTEPSIYWGNGENSNVSFWNCTVGELTIIPGSSVQLYFNETAPEFQCTIPSMIIGYGSNTESLESEYKSPFGGYIIANPKYELEDKTKLIIYGALLNETIEIETGSGTSLLDTVLSMDVVII
jgi:hypothetical protein